MTGNDITRKRRESMTPGKPRDPGVLKDDKIVLQQLWKTIKK